MADNDNLEIEVPVNLQEETSIEDNSSIIAPETQQLLEDEIKLEEQFGNSPTRTFAESALSGATFGISDQALVGSGLSTEEELRERRNRNEEAALAGEVTGIVVPALASGGSSILAKGAATVGKGVSTATKAGKAVEQLTAKGLEKLAKSTGNKKLAQSVLSKAAQKASGSAVEGSFYGAGQLIKENALGEADFNAENLLAYTGMGSALSGAAGGLFGTAQALVPVINKKTGAIKDYVTKKVKLGDANQAAAEVSGLTPSRITKIKEQKADVYKNLGDYYKNRIKLKATDSAESIYNKNQQAIEQIGKDIGETLKKVDDIATPDQLPGKESISKKIIKQLDDLAEDFKDLPSGAAKRKLNTINKEQKFWEVWANKGSKNLSAKDVQKLKIKLQNLASWERTFDKTSVDEKMARKASEAVRETMLDIADAVSSKNSNLGAQLRQQNLDFGTAMELANSLRKKVDKQASSKNLIGLKDLLLGDIFIGADKSLIGAGAIAGKKFAESDLRRKLTILSGIEKANQNIESTISKSISNFFQKTNKIPPIPTSTKILLNTNFNLESKRKKPKTKKEAFNNLKTDLEKLQSNPELLMNHITKNNLRITNAAPDTAGQVDQSIIRAIQFLNNKMPKPIQTLGMVQMMRKTQEFEPSSMQLAKFERYLEAVEHPISVVKDLEKGIISREGVEAVKVVYPNLFKRMQTSLINKMGEDPEIVDNIPYNQRLQLGIVMEVPTDTSLLPENIKALQQIHEQTSQEPEIRSKGLDNLSIADSAQSGTEKISRRE